MSKPTKIIVDCSTGEQTVVELTDAEIAEIQTAQAQAQTDAVARQAEADRIAALKASAKAKLVAGEPMTDEEAALLIN